MWRFVKCCVLCLAPSVLLVERSVTKTKMDVYRKPSLGAGPSRWPQGVAAREGDGQMAGL